MENLRIGIIGNIGVGKSILTEEASKPPLSDLLLDALPGKQDNAKIHVFAEEFSDEVLEAFGKDPERHAFMAQIEFFNGRLARQRRIAHAHGIVLEDRTLAEDYHIFGKAQKVLGNMTTPEFLAYQRTFRLMAAEVAEPDLIVYLKADVDTLINRIQKRGRDAEKGLSKDYLKTLNVLYESFVNDYVKCPVITIDANQDYEEKNYFNNIIQKVADQMQTLGVRVTTPGICQWVSMSETKGVLKATQIVKELKEYLKENPKLINISGLVGLGKSTLAVLMENELEIGALYEKPLDNPLLMSFLENKKKYAYDLQRHFLDMRSEQRIIGKNGDQSYVKDRSLPEDYLTFSRHLHQRGYLTLNQLELLETAFLARCKELPQSDLIVHLQGSPELAWQRILQRGRPAEVEGGWTPEEINALGNLYQTYPSDVVNRGFHQGPVLEIDMNRINLLNRVHLGYVFEKIHETLKKHE